LKKNEVMGDIKRDLPEGCPLRESRSFKPPACEKRDCRWWTSGGFALAMMVLVMQRPPGMPW